MNPRSRAIVAALSEPHLLGFYGHEYMLYVDRDNINSARFALALGELGAFAEIAMGPEQLDRFEATEPSAEQYVQLIQYIQLAYRHFYEAALAGVDPFNRQTVN